jgi:rare lipoprotein A
MANGRPFNMYAPTIAHKELPLGTKVELRNPRNGQRVVAVVTDRGPYIEGRDVDLSYGLAKKLDMVEQGVGKLMMRIIG